MTDWAAHWRRLDLEGKARIEPDPQVESLYWRVIDGVPERAIARRGPGPLKFGPWTPVHEPWPGNEVHIAFLVSLCMEPV